MLLPSPFPHLKAFLPSSFPPLNATTRLPPLPVPPTPQQGHHRRPPVHRWGRRSVWQHHLHPGVQDQVLLKVPEAVASRKFRHTGFSGDFLTTGAFAGFETPVFLKIFLQNRVFWRFPRPSLSRGAKFRPPLAACREPHCCPLRLVSGASSFRVFAEAPNLTGSCSSRSRLAAWEGVGIPAFPFAQGLQQSKWKWKWFSHVTFGPGRL